MGVYMARVMKLEGLNLTILSLVGNGTNYTKDLATETKRSQVVITQHLNTLEKCNFVRRFKHGLITEILPTPLGESIVRLAGNNCKVNF